MRKICTGQSNIKNSRKKDSEHYFKRINNRELVLKKTMIISLFPC